MFLYKTTLNMLYNKAEQSWFASLTKNSISLQNLHIRQKTKYYAQNSWSLLSYCINF